MKILSILFGTLLCLAFNAHGQVSRTADLDIGPLQKKLSEGLAEKVEWTRDPIRIALELHGRGWRGDPPSITFEVTGERKKDRSDPTGYENPFSVTVKEIGFADDDIYRGDRIYSFRYVDGQIELAEARGRSYSYRTDYPQPETNDPYKRKAGICLAYAAASNPQFIEAAAANGVADPRDDVSAVIKGDADTLKRLLNLSTKLSGPAAESYADLLYGLKGVFEWPTLSWFLLNVNEPEQKAVREIIKKVEDTTDP